MCRHICALCAAGALGRVMAEEGRTKTARRGARRPCARAGRCGPSFVRETDGCLQALEALCFRYRNASQPTSPPLPRRQGRRGG